LPAAAILTDRIRDLYGVELVQRVVEVTGTPSRSIRISGFIGQAGLSRQTRTQQLVFVNGRAIESSFITAAIREGYHTALMKGQYPVTFFFLEIDPASVDVNVHPAKREVRFRDPNGVREAIVQCIQQTLEAGRAAWQEKFRAPAPVPTVAGKPVPDLWLRPEESGPEESSRELLRLGSAVAAKDALAGVGVPDRVVKPDELPSSTPSKHDTNQQQFQIIGVLSKLY